MTFQYLRPDADDADGNWKDSSGSTTMFDKIDETVADDNDYIISAPLIAGDDTVRVRLSNPSGSTSEPATVRYRFKIQGTGPVTLTGVLMQGSTEIASWDDADVTTSFTTMDHALTTAQFNAISDFNDLYLKFLAKNQWWLSGSSIDLDFSNGRYYDSADSTPTLTDYLSCSRASVGYANNADGTLTSFASNTLRIGVGTGLLVEGARTNDVLWNQDLTNAVWAKTNMTAALDQTGPDGVVNSASSILATAGNATVLQSITLASAARHQSAYVKRITGSGTINMTMDNGATWTAITVTSDWTLAEIPTQTLANPTVGFRIVTNGDKIAVDFVQNENGAFASSSISTTTTSATRAADDVALLGTSKTLLESSAAQSGVADIKTIVAVPNNDDWNAVGNVPVSGDSFLNTRSQIIGRMRLGGVLEIISTTITGLFSTGLKVGYSGGPSGATIQTGDSPPGTTANAIVGIANPKLGGMGGSGNFFFGYFRRLTFWNSRLSDAALAGFTAP